VTATMGKVEELLAQGWGCQHRGDALQAEQLYLQAVQMDGSHHEAWSCLGVLCLQQGRLDDASGYLRRVVQLKPDWAAAHSNLGVALAGRGLRAEAIASFEEALKLDPRQTDARYNLGNALREEGRLEEAVACFREVLARQPAYAAAHTNLGWILFNLGRPAEAGPHLRRAVELAPNDAPAHHNLGRLLIEQDQLAEAIRCLQQACRLQPDGDAHATLGIALAKQGRSQEALASLKEAARFKPDSPDVLNSAGVVHAEQGDFEAALSAFQEALRLRPDFADVLANQGDALRRYGRLEESEASLRRALELQNNHVHAHHNLALTLADEQKMAEALHEFEEALGREPENPTWRRNRALIWLRLGEWDKGWPEFEYRWKCKEFVRSSGRSRHAITQPRWDGSPLAGKTILLHTEQGLGDTMQFIRYAPLVQARGGKVLLECPTALHPLLAYFPGIERLLAEGSSPPAFDVHAPLMSLPGIFGTTVSSVPAAVPYLYAHPQLAKHWQRELEPIKGFRIGICWQGNRKFAGDRLRSFSLSELMPLARLPRVRLVSLQKGPAMEQLAQVRGHFEITDLGERLDQTAGAFMDTAAVMANLDLVITCDTAIGHLAGALGIPVWLALSFVSDWRWLLDRPDTPWYPTMRLFRQQTLGKWEDIFASMARELERLLSAVPRTPAQG